MRIDAILLHGIEMQYSNDGFYEKLVSGIRKYLPLDFEVVFHPVNWSRLIEPRQELLYKWLKPYYRGLDVTLSVGCRLINDVIAYAPPEGTPQEGDVYYEVNKEVKDEYGRIKEKNPDSKVICIGHSLGGQIGLTFAYRNKIDALITMGSPIVHYSTRFKDGGSYSPLLEPKKMFCFWGKSDIVCPSPVSVNPVFKGKVVDLQVTSWNPLDLGKLRAHTIYWGCDFVHKEIAKILMDLQSR